MPICPIVADNGLNELYNNATAIYLCSATPGSYNDAVSVYALGYQNYGAQATVGAPNDVPNGRMVVTAQIVTGIVIVTGLATAWAIVDTVNQNLLAFGAMSSPLSLQVGNSFALNPFSITLPLS